MLGSRLLVHERLFRLCSEEKMRIECKDYTEHRREDTITSSIYKGEGTDSTRDKDILYL